VERPAFVFGCGDITEWPTHAAKSTYERLITSRLKFPAYDVMGNHDEGGQAPSETIKQWLISRHGSLTYSFEAGGVRFIALYSKYDENLNNPAQPLTAQALAELRQLLRQAPADQPTIVATHLCFDALTNKDALLEVLKPFHVLAILGGHYHKAHVDHYGGRIFVQIPSPAPGSASEFLVVRITPRRIVAVPYDYQKRTWSLQEGEVLDAALPAPAAAAASGEPGARDHNP
jgi:3',5'-cyclic AMP phosphodiesterase CpdA